MVDGSSNVTRSIPSDETPMLAVEQIGGIDACEVAFEPGVTILEGRNATNRTSLLTAIRDVLGGSPAAMKTHADQASIELTVAGETYERRYRREGEHLVSSGTTFSDERAIIDHFVSLLGDNAIRSAVERGDDLRELILEPVDTVAIEEEINTLVSERERLKHRLEEIRTERERLPALEERRRAQEARLEEIEEELRRIDNDLEEYATHGDEREQSNEVVEELREKRQELVDIREQLDTQRERISACRERTADLEDELAGITVPTEQIERIEEQIERLERDERSLDKRIMDLQQIIRFNRDVISGEGPQVSNDDPGDLAGALAPSGQELECWTCGHVVERETVLDRIERLEATVEEWKREQRSIESDIEELDTRLSELRSAEEREADIREEIATTREEIDIREGKIEHLETREEDISDTVTALERRAADTEEDEDESDVIAAYRRQSELEYERGQIEQELSDVREDIAELESLADEAEELEAEIATTDERLTALRSRIEEIEVDVVEAFNEHMDAVLSLLDFDNLARIWIERKADTSPGGRSFELHIVREDPDGTGYEDSIDTLSESEREVIGLVVGLAGYLAYEASDESIFVLLDSLEAIDADRIDTLVSHFATHVPFLVIALLPEDAAELPDRYHTVPSERLRASSAQ